MFQGSLASCTAAAIFDHHGDLLNLQSRSW
jgi:hypothetical protein